MATNICIIEESRLEKLEADIALIIELLKKKEKQNYEDEWLDSMEVRRILKISQRTWQTYRDRMIISFSQFGRKIFVKRSDLNKFLESHHIKRYER